MKTNKPKVIYRRKLGHLWRVLFGIGGGTVVYGYGKTQREARAQAALTYMRVKGHNV
jgi:hypothetical protein